MSAPLSIRASCQRQTRASVDDTPLRLRTGKAINKERREIAVHFKAVPHEPFDDRDRPNVLRF